MPMNAPRFFCDEPLTVGARVSLPKTVSHHIRVRRLKAGQMIVLFDGSGVEFECLLQFEADGQALALVSAALEVNRELRGKVVLVQGIASQDRMDWVIQKAVELGVAELIPIAATRSVVKLTAERATKRAEHWRKLVISASEQCGRNRLMNIHPPRELADAIAICQALPILLCHFNADSVDLAQQDLVQRTAASGAICIVVGPEGGWDEAEAQRWLDAGALPTSLGARVLRTETAGAAATAALTALLNW